MNIASFLQPKDEVAYVYDNMKLPKALEKLKVSGYSAIPVIDVEYRYVGVVSEGDFLWSIMEYSPLFNANLIQEESRKKLENMTVRDILRFGSVSAVCIDTKMEELLEYAKNQNFVPVIDDRSIFIGIVTRRDIIKYFVKLYNNNQNLNKIETFFKRIDND